jgi:5-methylcytosine-specific restriction endonuclease McrA
MNAEKRVWVTVVGGHPDRILRARPAVFNWGVLYEVMRYGDAVKAVRHQLFLRSKGECEQCSSPITERAAHMHERKHRGKGGEISFENSILICAACHRFDHRDRNPRFQRRNS